MAGPATADKWDRKLWKAIDDLAEFPGSGAPRPFLGEHVRIAIVHPYVVIYEHLRGSDAAHVLRVLHGRRRITTGMLRP
jgi:toxin ParE1/3/4